MRVLFDQGTPVPLRQSLTHHDVATAYERGWSQLKNGELLSRSRIKRLQKLSQPQYRLRIGDVRVFYDVSEKNVEVLAIVLKPEATTWLAKHGKSE